MTTITDEQKFEYEETFNLFDTKGDKKVFVRDVAEILRVLGTNPTEAEIKRACDTLTPEERIDFTRFLPILQTIIKNQETPSVNAFTETFRTYDNDERGVIQSSVLRQLLTSLGDRMTDAEVDALFQGHIDQDGNVNYEEFVKSIASG